MSGMTLSQLTQGLHGTTTAGGLSLQAEQLTESEVSMVRVTVEDREEFPIFVTLDDDQILCTTYLFQEGEVKADKGGELNATMLGMNVPMPLSSFGKVGDQYLLFGAMAVGSSLGDIQLEIETLSDNTLGAIEALAEFLN